jgi:NADPH2:quinone reductase
MRDGARQRRVRCHQLPDGGFTARVTEITSGQGVKVVYDGVGKDIWDKSLDCLRPFGLMASFGNASGVVPPFSPAILGAKGSLYLTRGTLFTHLTSPAATQAMADDLFSVVTSGQVKIHIDQRYRLAYIARTHRELEARPPGCTSHPSVTTIPPTACAAVTSPRLPPERSSTPNDERS